MEDKIQEDEQLLHSAYTKLVPEEFESLEHHGVKGMKWGVRKDRGHGGERATIKKINKLDSKFEKRGTSVNMKFDIWNKAARLTNDNDIDRINNKPKYRDLDFGKESKLLDQYYDEHATAFNNNLNRAAKEFGTNASGTKEYGIRILDNDEWFVTLDDVKHSADDPDGFSVYLVRDEAGYITGYSLTKPLTEDESRVVRNQLRHMGENDLADSLEHYGVLGMKWGVRKDRSATLTRADGSTFQVKVNPKKDKITQTENGRVTIESTSKGRTKRLQRRVTEAHGSTRETRAVDTAQLSDSELRTMINRLQMEKQLTDLVDQRSSKTTGSKAADVIKKNAARIVQDTTVRVGTDLATKYLSNAARVQINKRVPKSYRVGG